MIKYYLSLSALFIFVNISAQHNWTINSDDFSYTHKILGKAYVGGGIVNGQNIEVGAFYGNECRGIAVTDGGACTYNTFDLTIYSNQQQGEEITFVIRDTDLTEYSIINTVIFSSGEETGDFKDPFLWMDEWLYQSTDFFVFQVTESNSDATINLQQKTISLNVSPETDLSSLTPLYFIAPGAKVFIGETEQISQENIVDFTNPQTYSIFGVDGLQTDWIVSVSHEPTSIFINDMAETSIFPTVSESGTFVLSLSNTSTYSIYSIDGRKINTGIAFAGNNSIEINETGYFIIKITGLNQESKQFRLVVTK